MAGWAGACRRSALHARASAAAHACAWVEAAARAARIHDTQLDPPARPPLPPCPCQVEEAARAACIHDTIMERFPAKYDTVVGERGLRLR